MRFLHVALLLVAVSCLATPAAAAGGSNATDAPTNATIKIDDETELLASGYDADAGEAWVELRSEDHQPVTISDGGALTTGSGSIPTTTVAFDAGESARIRVPVTEVDGRVAVVIDTRRKLYGEVIEPGGGPSPFQRTSPTEGWLGGATAVMAMTVLAGYRVLNNDPEEPEQMV